MHEIYNTSKLERTETGELENTTMTFLAKNRIVWYITRYTSSRAIIYAFEKTDARTNRRTRTSDVRTNGTLFAIYRVIYQNFRVNASNSILGSIHTYLVFCTINWLSVCLSICLSVCLSVFQGHLLQFAGWEDDLHEEQQLDVSKCFATNEKGEPTTPLTAQGRLCDSICDKKPNRYFFQLNAPLNSFSSLLLPGVEFSLTVYFSSKQNHVPEL